MKVIIINGPMGVGKTTVGRFIADSNPGTAFIDGDWCMDIHPFVGNTETKAMAVDNILHMVANYKNCTACKMVVLVWLMDDPWVIQRISEGIADSETEILSATLICDRESLISRWKHDKDCEWITDEWLDISLKSLQLFVRMANTIDTNGLSVEQIAEIILKMK